MLPDYTRLQDESSLRITIYPYLRQSLPAVIRWLLLRGWVQPELRQYLSAVLTGFEWFLTCPQPVEPNPFGPDPWS